MVNKNSQTIPSTTLKTNILFEPETVLIIDEHELKESRNIELDGGWLKNHRKGYKFRRKMLYLGQNIVQTWTT